VLEGYSGEKRIFIKRSATLIKEIARDFFMITLPMPFRLEHVNVYTLVHDGRMTLFDTGLNTPETFTTLEAGLKRIGRSIHDIDRIYITHRHGDHCGMAARIKAASGATILMSDVDHEFIRISEDQDRLLAILRSFYLRHGLGDEALALLGSIFRSFSKMIGTFPLDHALRPGEIQTVGDRSCEVIAAPGHSRGQVCFFFRKEGILLAGDHILPDITPNLSPDLFQTDFRPLEHFLSSLTRMQSLPVKTVYPAHGRPFTNFLERITEIKDHHHERKGLTLAAVRGGRKSTFEVSVDIFGKDLPDFDQYLALNETYVHLVQLIHEGLVQEEIEDNRCFYMEMPQ
jgi:glyoxylase-like metal-dependent hydrolase (beta-lactamase superfamily II)